VTDEVDLLDASAHRLASVVRRLSPQDLRSPAYPSEWTIADVLSHLGSGAVISGAWIDQGLGGAPVDPAPIWAEWNAKDPDAKAASFLHADQEFLSRARAVADQDRQRFHLDLGPMQLDFAGLMRTRVNEHTLHSWDVLVMLDPAATLPADQAAAVLDALPMVGGYSGKPTGADAQVRVRAGDANRTFTIGMNSERVVVSPADGSSGADLVMPAEALVRLVYGRLDGEHTPPYTGSAETLELLRQTFRGV
jgi:uncharacterized protein (TIGR03083 family)